MIKLNRPLTIFILSSMIEKPPYFITNSYVNKKPDRTLYIVLKKSDRIIKIEKTI